MCSSCVDRQTGCVGGACHPRITGLPVPSLFETSARSVSAKKRREGVKAFDVQTTIINKK